MEWSSVEAILIECDGDIEQQVDCLESRVKLGLKGWIA